MASAGSLHPQVDVNHDEVWDKVEAGEYQPGSNGKVLDETSRIFKEWPRPPPDGHFHIFVELPTHGKCKLALFGHVTAF